MVLRSTQFVHSRRRLRIDLRWIAAGAIVLSALVMLGLQIRSMERTQEALLARLGNERTALLKQRTATRDLERRFANYVLENRVRREIVDGRMSAQEQRSAELRRQAELVRQQKLVEANCITPRSVTETAGL
jgi:hypothetical protein